MTTQPIAGVTYPRDVQVLAGMPEGWYGRETQYSATSKTAGMVYVRYYSKDGRHRHVCSPKQVIELHYKGLGEDPSPYVAAYQQIMRDKAAAKKAESEARGKLKGQNREEAIERFRAKFGELKGPLVFNFPGWITRWHYQPKCDQVMVEYLDTEGNSWKLLKDLECAFQVKIDNGEEAAIQEMLDQASIALSADPDRFGSGSKGARQVGGVFEMRGDSNEEKSFTQEERSELVVERKGPVVKKRSKKGISFSIEHAVQTGWAAMETKADVQQAFGKFHDLLVGRGFKPSAVELRAVFGVDAERKYKKRMSGVYFRMPDNFGGSPCYQKLIHCPDCKEQIGCDGLYLVFNSSLQFWEVTTHLQEDRPVLAHSAKSGASAPAAEAQGPWQVQDGLADYNEDAGLQILAPEGGGSSPAAAEASPANDAS